MEEPLLRMFDDAFSIQSRPEHVKEQPVEEQQVEEQQFEEQQLEEQQVEEQQVEEQIEYNEKVEHDSHYDTTPRPEQRNDEFHGRLLDGSIEDQSSSLLLKGSGDRAFQPSSRSGPSNGREAAYAQHDLVQVDPAQGRNESPFAFRVWIPLIWLKNSAKVIRSYDTMEIKDVFATVESRLTSVLEGRFVTGLQLTVPRYGKEVSIHIDIDDEDGWQAAVDCIKAGRKVEVDGEVTRDHL